MHPVLAVVIRLVALLLALQIPIWGLEAASGLLARQVTRRRATGGATAGRVA